MKAAMNGALNLSVADGWWPEAFDGENGWVIGDGNEFEDHHARDRNDAQSLYRTLEESVLPSYYDRDEDGLSRSWIHRMKSSIATITPRFSADRMVHDYTVEAYLPRGK